MVPRPYKLLDYYETKDADLFFGRMAEIRDLAARIQAHRSLLLHGASGAGKTSLLLAGIGPIFEHSQSPDKLVYVRAFEDPFQAVNQAIRRKLLTHGQKDVVGIEPDTAVHVDLPQLRQMISTSFNKSEMHDLCFDLRVDYEDLPEGNKQDKIRELLTYCQRRGRLPDLLAACRNQRPRLEWPGAPDPVEDIRADQARLLDLVNEAIQTVDGTIILILDQFEEYFVRLNRQTRAAFFAELGALYHAADIPVKLVLSLREDWLASVSELEEVIPEIFRNRMRLLPLNREQARQAITDPVAGLVRYQPDLVARLLDDLVGNEDSPDEAMGSVMPPELQLVCNALYEQALINDSQEITTDDYDALGGAQGVLSRYLTAELRRFPGQEMLMAKAVLEELVSAERTKRAASCDELALILDVAAEVLSPVLEKLVKARLIRPLERPFAPDYELMHDYLVNEIELTPEVQMRKAVEELIAQELKSWRTLQTVISPDRLRIISEWRDRLRLSAEAQELIEKSLQQKALDEEWQLQLIQADKMHFLNQLVAGIDGEISSPIANIEANSNFLKTSIDEIKEHFERLPERLMALGTEPRLDAISQLVQNAIILESLGDINEVSGELREAAERMNRLIKALSNFAQRDTILPGSVDIQASLDAALLLLEHQMVRHRISTELDFSGYLTVNGSPSQLVQLFMNVLMHSVEGLKNVDTAVSGRRIHVSAYRQHHWIVVNFTHNGAPFTTGEFKSVLPLDSGGKMDEGQQSLGLSIAYQIVQRHEGSIDVANQGENETSLKIQLPLAEKDKG